MTAEQFALRAALLLGCIYPILSAIFHVLLKKSIIKHKK
jgi:hypothetical protein